MKPYYQHAGQTIYHGDCLEIMPQLEPVDLVLTDPPYNVGYKYESYNDSLSLEDYKRLLNKALLMPCVVIHYPENMYIVATALDAFPEKEVAWVYNAHTPKKWRKIAWFNISPDFSKLKQPFKNVNDNRILRKILNGEEGATLYDWWHIEQVKNVSKEKTNHPCQIPVKLIKQILGITDVQTIVDPFLGSGTTLVAAKELGRKAIGIEIEEKYCEIAARRLSQEVFDFDT